MQKKQLFRLAELQYNICLSQTT